MDSGTAGGSLAALLPSTGLAALVEFPPALMWVVGAGVLVVFGGSGVANVSKMVGPWTEPWKERLPQSK